MYFHRPTRKAGSLKNPPENEESFHCIAGEESSRFSSILRGGNFPIFVLELVVDFLAPKRICQASCVCSSWHDACSFPPCRIWAKQFERRWPLRSFSVLNEWLRAKVRPPVTFVAETILDLSSSCSRFPMGGYNIQVDWFMMFRERWISEMKARCGRKGLLVCPWFNCASIIQDGKAFKRYARSPSLEQAVQSLPYAQISPPPFMLIGSYIISNSMYQGNDSSSMYSRTTTFATHLCSDFFTVISRFTSMLLLLPIV